MAARIAASLLLLSLCACIDPFEEACDVLKRMPHGIQVSVLERRLSLPEPSKTMAGTSFYHHRIFEYRCKDGLMVVLGLIQTSETMDYPQGRFVTRGHYMVFKDSRKWVQWEWDDGKELGQED
jgi:hypothetical protein